MTAENFNESWLERLKEVSRQAGKAREESAKSLPGDAGLTQRQVAYDKLKEWATMAKEILVAVAAQFRMSRGEPINKQTINVLVGLLRQLRNDYESHIIRNDSELRRSDSSYQVTELVQEEQFWNSWEPLFNLANAYSVGAFEQPAPGIGRVEFELKRGDWSSDIRRNLDVFTKQFVGVLEAFIELPRPS